MRKLVLLSLIPFAAAVSAANVEAPPTIDSAEAVQAPAAQSVQSRKPAAKAPTQKEAKENMQRARKTMEQSQKRTGKPSNWPKTKIVETVDNRGQVTEVTVTPMSTQIPYTMKREAQGSPQAQDTAAGKGSTMSVPKFINFGF